MKIENKTKVTWVTLIMFVCLFFTDSIAIYSNTVSANSGDSDSIDFVLPVDENLVSFYDKSDSFVEYSVSQESAINGFTRLNPNYDISPFAIEDTINQYCTDNPKSCYEGRPLCFVFPTYKCALDLHLSLPFTLKDGGGGGDGGNENEVIRKIDSVLNGQYIVISTLVRLEKMVTDLYNRPVDGGGGGGSPPVVYPPINIPDYSEQFDYLGYKLGNLESLIWSRSSEDTRDIKNTVEDKVYGIERILRFDVISELYYVGGLVSSVQYKTGQIDEKIDGLVGKFDSMIAGLKSNEILLSLNKIETGIQKNVLKLEEVVSELTSLNTNVTDYFAPKETDLEPNFVFQSLLSKMDEIIGAIQSLDFTMDFEQIVDKTGTNFWDFLTGLFDNLFGLVEFLVEKIIMLVIPEDSTFVQTGFQMLSDALNDKFEAVDVLKMFLVSSFQVEEKEFPDYKLTLPMYGEVQVLNTEWINKWMPIFRGMVAGFLYLMTGIWAYKKITNGLIN